MRLQTRLFLGTALLVLGLVGIELWMQVTQLRQIERGLGEVATSVGKAILEWPRAPLFSWDEETSHGEESHGEKTPCAPRISRRYVWMDDRTSDGEPGAEAEPTPSLVDGFTYSLPDVGGAPIAEAEAVIELEAERAELERAERRLAEREASRAEAEARVAERSRLLAEKMARGELNRRLAALKVDLQVIRDRAHRVLVISGVPGGEERIRLPVADSLDLVRSNLRRGVLASGGLLLVGLTGAAFIARRVARPLGELATAARRIGEGGVGETVAVTGSGEVAEVERAFNEMSLRLAELERDRERWRAREHLAELGDVARGLAHTLRNPLNTLGLAVEELAGGEDRDRDELVVTARAEIGRIDRWLRSFLAIGAGQAARSEAVDLAQAANEIVFESVQRGAPIRCRVDDGEAGPVWVVAVPQALRAALGNLVDNAVEATPAGESVEVSVARCDGEAVVTVADRGPGLPDEVRERLFSPHVTTKAGGSGMGLFLARQLVVTLQSGTLEVGPRDGGGTVAEIRLPVAEEPGPEAEA